MKTCSVDGCTNKAKARGWCHKHYKRWQMRGDPLKAGFPQNTMDFSERFWMQVNKAAIDGCWEWVGSRSHFGYGQTRRAGKFYSAHRLSYKLHNGPIPIGMQVCHRCDNPPCINPEHLFLGTGKDNMQDMIAKGRDINRRGEIHHRAKLTWADVEAIRFSAETAVSLAPKFGVSVGTICLARRGKTWRDSNYRQGK